MPDDLRTLDFRSPMPVSADALFAWHERPGAFSRLAPPWAPVRLQAFEGIRDGQEAVIRLGFGPLSLKWVARHRDYQRGRQFVDEQVRGPFARWTHTHRMEPAGPDASLLHDHIDYALPFGALGALGSGRLRRELHAQFAYRHRTTRDDLRAHARYSTTPMRIAITGASGLLGTALTDFLTTGGHTVLPVSRTRHDAGTVVWNPRMGEIEADKLEGVDAVVHLAGENVFGLRWSQEKKERILASRVNGTALLATTLAGLKHPPKVLVSASAIGYYGDRGSEVLTETSAPAEAGFLSLVCREWETAADPARAAGIRVVHPRIGVVLTPRGGALELMLPAFKTGLGGRVGPADQWFSWVALDDVLGAILHALATDTLDGPMNTVAPNPVTMATFTETMGAVLSRPTVFNVPTGLVRMLGGEMADETLLQSARVHPAVLKETGYDFRFPHLNEALRHLLGKTPSSEDPSPTE